MIIQNKMNNYMNYNYMNYNYMRIISHTYRKFTIVMAGGSGTRMGSSKPKQLHIVGRKPMMIHLIDNAYQLGTDIIVVLSEKNKDIILTELCDNNFINKINNDYYYKDAILNICIQPIANGTGGALMATSSYFDKINNDMNNESVSVVLSADVPLISKHTIKKLFDMIETPNIGCVILAKDTTDNYGYGRIILGDGNKFEKIVEQKDCTENEAKVTLINTGTYGFKMSSVLKTLTKITNNNNQKEYYLTDCPKLITDNQNDNVVKIVTSSITQYDETLGANTPEQLDILRKEYFKKFSVENITSSCENTENYNLRNLVNILSQLSASNPVDTNIESNIDILKDHIKNNETIDINKKHIFVVKYENDIIGTGSILIENKILRNMSKVSHIEDIVIDNEYRGFGLAKILMEALIRYSKNEGCYKIILDASDDVKGFYEKLGFKHHANSMRLDI